MQQWNKQKSTNLYSREQVERIVNGIGLGVHGEVETDFVVYCPFHGNVNTPAAEIDKLTGIFYCFACKHVASLEEVVMEMTNKGYFAALRYIDEMGTETDLEESISKMLEPRPEFIEFDSAVVSKLHLALMQSQEAQEYLLNRKIASESFEKYMLGYSAKQQMVTIPVHSPAGLIIGFVGRSIKGKVFKNSKRLPRSKTLFNLHRNKFNDNVFITESAFDAIVLEQHGASAVASLGSSISKEQLGLLRKYFATVIALGDSDTAGKQMNATLKQELTEQCIIATIDTGAKDVSEMQPEALTRLIQSNTNLVFNI